MDQAGDVPRPWSLPSQGREVVAYLGTVICAGKMSRHGQLPDSTSTGGGSDWPCEAQALKRGACKPSAREAYSSGYVPAEKMRQAYEATDGTVAISRSASKPIARSG